ADRRAGPRLNSSNSDPINARRASRIATPSTALVSVVRGGASEGDSAGAPEVHREGAPTPEGAYLRRGAPGAKAGCDNEFPGYPGLSSGAPPGIRTQNLRIKSPLLCR